MDLESRDKQKQLRELLDFFVERLKVTQVDLSKWMDISRPLINKFLNSQDVENAQKLPIKRDGLINFCEELLSSAVSNPENTDIETMKLRQLFGEKGVDELLETAGLLPKNTQVIRVTPERFVSVAQIAALFELLTLEELIATTQGVVSIISPKVFPKNNYSKSDDLENDGAKFDALKDLIQSLEEPYQSDSSAKVTETLPDNPWRYHPILGVKRRIEIGEKLQTASNRLRAGGKINFTHQEAISLFLSIAIKEQIPDFLSNLNIRIQKFEITTLSHVITLEEAENEKYAEVYRHLLQCIYQEECHLKNPNSKYVDDCENESIKSKSLDWFDPVRIATVTCRFGIAEKGEKQSEPIKWIYNSSNTILENGISACSLLLGITEDYVIPNVLTNTKSLDGSINSLVEASVILDKKYQGIWVDRDLNITILQALVCAAKQWLGERVYKGELNLEVYVHGCKSISKLRQNLYYVRQKFQNFEFVDYEQQSELFPDTENKFSIGKSEKIRETLNEIAKDARNELKQIPEDKIYFLLRLSLYRCHLLAKLMLLRLENSQGNISNVKQLLNELESVLDEDNDIKDQLIPIQALLHTERILYELSLGNRLELFDNEKRSEWLNLEQWKKNIYSAIKPGTFYKDPGVDIYHALSEIYGNCARIELYLSDNSKVLENAADNFLRAAHYALRIGYKQRASRWFALAGRVWLRLNDEEKSKQSLNLAKKLAFSNLTSWHDFNFRQAICSEISLLEGEILLVLENKPSQAINWFLKALKGAIHLRLNRRMCDAMINISRCSQKLGDRSVKTDLDQIFSHPSDDVFPYDNRSTEIVMKFIKHLLEREDNPRWSSVSEDFANTAAQMWQDWHDIGGKTEINHSQHPIAAKIINGTLYVQIK
jgi:hypothetical protein